MDIVKQINNSFGFNWDSGNQSKNFDKHKVEQNESEQIFIDTPVFLFDEKHSQIEDRYTVYGETELGRKLNLIFTFRKNQIRVISARDQSKKEKVIYLKSIKI